MTEPNEILLGLDIRATPMRAYVDHIFIHTKDVFMLYIFMIHITRYFERICIYIYIYQQQ